MVDDSNHHNTCFWYPLPNQEMKVISTSRAMSFVLRVLAFAATSSSSRSRAFPMVASIRPSNRWQQGLPSRQRLCFASVSGTAYTSDEADGDAPVVKLFTKEGCTLCDKVKDVLVQVREDCPHSLEQVDITDKGNEEWFNKYKYDIPVLHLNNQFWIKHQTTPEEAMEGLVQAKAGIFEPQDGEPDAEEMERRQAEREKE